MHGISQRNNNALKRILNVPRDYKACAQGNVPKVLFRKRRVQPCTHVRYVRQGVELSGVRLGGGNEATMYKNRQSLHASGARVFDVGVVGAVFVS